MAMSATHQHRVAIIGAGNSGVAMAAFLAKKGERVLVAGTQGHPGRIPAIVAAGNTIEIEHDASYEVTTGDISQAVACPVIIITVPGNAHEDLVTQLAQFDLSNSIAVVMPSGLFAAHAARRMIQAHRPKLIVGSASAAFASRLRQGNTVGITRTKNVLEVGANDVIDNSVMQWLGNFFPAPLQWFPNISGRVFDNINMVIHTTAMLVYRHKIADPNQTNPLFYEECMETAAVWINGVDAERCQVAAALNNSTKTLLEFFRGWYHPEAPTYIASVRNTPSYTGRRAPDLHHRYLLEDVPLLTMVRDIGNKMEISTPNMDRVVSEASLALQIDFSALGLAAHNMQDATIQEILHWLNGKVSQRNSA